MQRSTKFFDNHCASYNVIFLVPKTSIETNISKKSCFHEDKSFWPVFRRIIDCYKPEGFFWASKKYVDNYCGSIRIIFVTPKRLFEA